MAKSLRSKWKRKMRAEKRVRYGAKEKAKLVKMLDDYKKEEEEKEQQHQPEVLGAPTSTTPAAAQEASGEEDMDATTEKARHSTKTLKNEHGSYPNWMSKRQIQKQKGKKKKLEGKVTKRHKKKYL